MTQHLECNDALQLPMRKQISTTLVFCGQVKYANISQVRFVLPLGRFSCPSLFPSFTAREKTAMSSDLLIYALTASTALYLIALLRAISDHKVRIPVTAPLTLSCYHSDYMLQLRVIPTVGGSSLPILYHYSIVRNISRIASISREGYNKVCASSMVYIWCISIQRPVPRQTVQIRRASGLAHHSNQSSTHRGNCESA